MPISDADHRVGVLPAGGEDDQRRDDHPGRAEQVGDHVAQRGRDVEALARVPRAGSRAATRLTASPADGDRQHQPRLDLGRIAEPHPGLDEDPDRDRDQGDAVEERGEDLGAPIAEGAAGAAGRPASQAANSATPSERVSESMWPASASSARLSAIRPPTTSTTRKAVVSARTSFRARLAPPDRGRRRARGRGRWARACEPRYPRRGRRYARAASSVRIFFGSMKRTSSSTARSSETSSAPRSRKNSTSSVDQLLGGAGAGGDADRLDALEPLLVDLGGVVDQVRGGAVLARDLDQAVGVRGVGRADHQHQLALAGELLDRDLAVGRRVTDVVGLRG